MGAIFGNILDQLAETAVELILEQINAQLALIGCNLSDIDNNSEGLRNRRRPGS